MTKTSVFRTEVRDIGLEFGQLDPPNIFSNDFFRVCTPVLKTNKQDPYSFIRVINQLDIAEEFEIMKLLLLEMREEDTRDKRVFNYLKHNIEFTNVLKDVFILPIKALEEYLEYMMELRATILDNFDLINISFTLEDDTLDTNDIYIADYYLGAIKIEAKDVDPEIKENQIRINIENELKNATMIEDIRNLYKSYNI